MKKHFILSLMAAVLMALNVNAQEENTYSMVITLANGTSITIGPNEVSNISFNDGEITVSGAKIEEMANDIMRNSENIYMLMSENQNNRVRIDNIENKVYENSDTITYNSNMIEQLKDEKVGREEYYVLRDLVDRNQYEINYEAKILGTGWTMGKLLNTVERLREEVDPRLGMLEYRVDKLESRVGELESK